MTPEAWIREALALLREEGYQVYQCELRCIDCGNLKEWGGRPAPHRPDCRLSALLSNPPIDTNEPEGVTDA